jgi:hypothetical protein
VGEREEGLGETKEKKKQEKRESANAILPVIKRHGIQLGRSVFYS